MTKWPVVTVVRTSTGEEQFNDVVDVRVETGATLKEVTVWIVLAEQAGEEQRDMDRADLVTIRYGS